MAGLASMASSALSSLGSAAGSAGAGAADAGSAAAGAAGAAGSGSGGTLGSLLSGGNPLFNSLAGNLTGSLFGGGGSPSAPMQFPQLQHPQGQPITPVTVPSVGNAGPLSGNAGISPQLMRLIQMLQGGGGSSGVL